VIYFAQATDGGPVKIGYTEDLEVRLHRLELHYGKPLALLATMPGDHSTEVEIHRRFGHLRLGRTEQFQPAAELMEFIGRPLLVAANSETVEVMPWRFDIVKMGADVVKMARHLAVDRNVPLAEYLTERIRPLVEQDFEEMTRRLGKPSSEPTRPRKPPGPKS
jgi:hypothetical protein